MGLPLETDARPITSTPTSGEGANQILEGDLTGVGPSRPINVYGAFNFTLYGKASYTITLQAGSSTATVTNGTQIAVGQTVVADALPPGTTLKTVQTVQVSGLTTVTLGGLTTSQVASITAGAQTATFVGVGITPVAEILLERTFDGGNTWVTAGIGGSGQPASYEFGSSAIDNPVSVVASEPERQVGYRFNCVSYTSGTIHYRLSITGLAAGAWGIPPS